MMDLAVRVALALLVLTSVARADPDLLCDTSVQPRSTHKVVLWLPEDDAGDAARRQRAVAALAPRVFQVIADYDVGVDSPVLVEVDDDQLTALADAGFETELADDHDRVLLPGVTTIADGRGRLEPPLRVKGWQLDARKTAAVPYVIHPAAPRYPGAWWDAMLARLGEVGVVPHPEYLGELVAPMTEAQARKVATFAEIGWVARIEPLYKLDTDLLPDAECMQFSIDQADQLTAVVGDARTGGQILDLAVTVFTDTPALHKAMRAAGATFVQDDDPTRFVVTAPRRALRALAVRPEVAEIALLLAHDLEAPCDR